MRSWVINGIDSFLENKKDELVQKIAIQLTVSLNNVSLTQLLFVIHDGILLTHNSSTVHYTCNIFDHRIHSLGCAERLRLNCKWIVQPQKLRQLMTFVGGVTKVILERKLFLIKYWLFRRIFMLNVNYIDGIGYGNNIIFKLQSIRWKISGISISLLNDNSLNDN